MKTPFQTLFVVLFSLTVAMVEAPKKHHHSPKGSHSPKSTPTLTALPSPYDGHFKAGDSVFLSVPDGSHEPGEYTLYATNKHGGRKWDKDEDVAAVLKTPTKRR